MNRGEPQAEQPVQTPARGNDVNAELLDSFGLQLLAAVLVVALAAGLSAVWPWGFALALP